jgi:hypothetical protein
VGWSGSIRVDGADVLTSEVTTRVDGGSDSRPQAYICAGRRAGSGRTLPRLLSAGTVHG